ncbi:hypothetical protein B0H10DRAFT_2226446 [Mycena sp. CBHHK59/15]|nr:hypothetical protein B0H10DRAFT_2226446 [Mycena sp. CBHHK59/15]
MPPPSHANPLHTSLMGRRAQEWDARRPFFSRFFSFPIAIESLSYKSSTTALPLLRLILHSSVFAFSDLEFQRSRKEANTDPSSLHSTSKDGVPLSRSLPCIWPEHRRHNAPLLPILLVSHPIPFPTGMLDSIPRRPASGWRPGSRALHPAPAFSKYTRPHASAARNPFCAAASVRPMHNADDAGGAHAHCGGCAE